MLHLRREPRQAATLLLSWLIAPVVVIGIGALAGLWMVVGAIVSLCEVVARSIAPARAPFGRTGAYAVSKTERAPR